MTSYCQQWVLSVGSASNSMPVFWAVLRACHNSYNFVDGIHKRRPCPQYKPGWCTMKDVVNSREIRCWEVETFKWLYSICDLVKRECEQRVKTWRRHSWSWRQFVSIRHCFSERDCTVFLPCRCVNWNLCWTKRHRVGFSRKATFIPPTAVQPINHPIIATTESRYWQRPYITN
jgi:hypothetical protein